MSTCKECGGELTFRYVNGRPTPIHLSGRCGGHFENRAASSKNGVAPKQIVRNRFTLNSFASPNARCPVCKAPVFFYQSPYDGRVFFDEIGPPWPKHPCTDSSIHSVKIEMIKTSGWRVKPKKWVYSWNKAGWRPFVCDVVEFSQTVTELRGNALIGDAPLILYTDNIGSHFEHSPLLIRADPAHPKRYEISMFPLGQADQIGSPRVKGPTVVSAFSDIFEYSRSKQNTEVKHVSARTIRLSETRKRKAIELAESDPATKAQRDQDLDDRLDQAFAEWKKRTKEKSK